MRCRMLMSLLLATAAAAQDGSQAERFLRQEEAAFVHYNRKDWTRAIAAFEQQIAIFSGNPRPYYNIACCYALLGDTERAATWLRLSIDNGWRDAEHLGKDPDFDRMRQSEPFQKCLAKLERARRQDPAPLPRLIPPEAVSSASSVRTILAPSRRQEIRLRNREDLLTEHQYRKLLFQLYDHRMALLTRYIAENGDAPDADQAAEARAQTAMAYLMRASGDYEQDRALRKVAGRYVLACAEEFLRGYPGSPRLGNVRYWRAQALARLGRTEPAERALRALVADHGEGASLARVELCALLADHGSREDLRKEYAAFTSRWKERGALPRSMGIRLAKARLLAEGLPHAIAQALSAPAAGGDAPLLYVFVRIDDVDSKLRMKQVRELAQAGRVRPVVIGADAPRPASDEEIRSWMETHAPGIPTIARGAEHFVDLWLSKVPTLLLVRNEGEVIAFDPTEQELDRLVGERSG